MQMIFQVVCYSSSSVTIIHSEERELRVSLKIGERGASVLVVLLVSLHVGHTNTNSRVGAVVRVLETEVTRNISFSLLVLERIEEFVPTRFSSCSLEQEKLNYFRTSLSCKL